MSSGDGFIHAAEGSIVSIKLTKFVNFRSIEFYPSPRLNIVTAPNGSGKSTLISAMVLALGGNPAIIGRSSQEVDYIMSGQKQAIIEIELNNPHGRNHVIKRKITRKSPNSATSEWFINNQKSSGVQVQSLVTKLNVQVDNLCQVLPQDRVQDFARMNSLEMFDNTLKTMGDSGLYKKYSHLKELRETQTQIAGNLDEATKKYESLTETIQGMENDVQVVMEHRKALKSVETCSRKLAWAVYNEKKSELDEVSDQLKGKEDELQKLESLNQPLKNKLRLLEKKASDCKKDVAAKARAANTVQKVLEQGREKVSSVACKIKSLKAEAVESARRRTKCLEEASQLEIQIANHKRRLGNYEESSVAEELNMLDNELNEFVQVRGQLGKTRSQLSSSSLDARNSMIAVERSLARATSFDQKKMELLRAFPGSLTVYEWIKNNKQKISAPVHGPLFLELNVQDMSKAKYVECVIPKRDIIAFIAESALATTELLTVRTEMNFTCNVACSEPPDDDINQVYRPKIPLSQIRSYGFDCYLIDLVKAPPAVLAYLCKSLNFHNIPVAFKGINSNNVPPSIKYYMAGDLLYRVSISKYSRQTCVSTHSIPPPRFVTTGIDPGIVAELNKQVMMKKNQVESIARELSNLETLERENEVALNNLRNKKRELSVKVEEHRGMVVRVKRLEDERQSLLERAKDPVTEEGTLYQKIKTAVEELVKQQADLVTKLKEFTEMHTASTLADIELDAVSVARLSVNDEIETASESVTSLKREVEELKKSAEEARKAAQEFENIAKRSTDSLSPGNPEFKKRFANAFARLPSTVAELRDKLRVLNVKARFLHNPLHDELLENYESKKAEARQCEEALEQIKKDSTSLGSRFSKLKDEWRTQLDNLVSQVDNSFSNFFRAMGCCGQVRLSTGEDEEIIEKYGLEMLVKFRDNQPLAVVDGFTQSGGEKALATAVFLLSLQRLSISPFHCMDEINQGMDEFNERRVYSLLFNTITDISAQFFLVTPKLMKDLDYPEHATVHIIFNSGAVNLSNEEDDEE